MVGMCSCLFPRDEGCIVVCSRLSVFAGNKHRCSGEMVRHINNLSSNGLGKNLLYELATFL